MELVASRARPTRTPEGGWEVDGASAPPMGETAGRCRCLAPQLVPSAGRTELRTVLAIPYCDRSDSVLHPSKVAFGDHSPPWGGECKRAWKDHY